MSNVRRVVFPLLFTTLLVDALLAYHESLWRKYAFCPVRQGCCHMGQNGFWAHSSITAKTVTEECRTLQCICLYCEAREVYIITILYSGVFPQRSNNNLISHKPFWLIRLTRASRAIWYNRYEAANNRWDTRLECVFSERVFPTIIFSKYGR